MGNILYKLLGFDSDRNNLHILVDGLVDRNGLNGLKSNLLGLGLDFQVLIPCDLGLLGIGLKGIGHFLGLGFQVQRLLRVVLSQSK